MNILIVSPHRDDAAFSNTLAVRGWLAAGHRVTVMNCFTRSSYAPFADAANVHANDLRDFVSALRLREDETWRKQLGSAALHLHDLNLRDAPLRLQCGFDDLCTFPVQGSDKALDTIAKAVERFPSAALVLPLAVGGHVDHRVAQQAAWKAAEGKAVAFYEDLPYAAQPALAATLGSFAAERATHLGIELHPALTTGCTSVDAILAKRRAALCYDSQIDDTTVEAIANFCTRYEGAERLWVNDEWVVQGLELEPFHGSTESDAMLGNNA